MQVPDGQLASQTDRRGFKSALRRQQHIVDTAASFKYSYVSTPGSIRSRRRWRGLPYEYLKLSTYAIA